MLLAVLVKTSKQQNHQYKTKLGAYHKHLSSIYICYKIIRIVTDLVLQEIRIF